MTEYSNKIVGKRLSEARKRSLISQDNAAKALNCSHSKISKHESGQIEISNEDLISYSKLYGVSVDYLLGNETESDRFTKSINAYRVLGLTNEELDELDAFVDYLLVKRIRK